MSSVSSKVVMGNSCTLTPPPRGTATSPSWQPRVRSPAASACVTCASGSTCMALTGWARWRCFSLTHDSRNNSKSSRSYFESSVSLMFSNCLLLSGDSSHSSRDFNLLLSEISVLFYWACVVASLCLLSLTRCPQEGMKVSLPGNNPSKHVTLQTSLSRRSLWAFCKGLSQVHFKMRNDKHKPEKGNVIFIKQSTKNVQ